MGKIVRYKMEMEVLTPVHIAGADYKSKLNKTEYIFNPNTNDLTIIDNNKFVNFLVEKKIIDKYLDEIRKNNKLNLFYFLKNSDLYKNKDRNKILYEDLRGFTKKSYKNLDIELKIKENERKENLNNITLLNKNVKDEVYIPGSSIKGALVNLLLVSYIINNRDEFVNEIKQIENEVENFDKKNSKFFQGKVKNVINKIQEKILYENFSNKKIKKFGISISDSYENKKDIDVNFYQDIDEKIKDKKESYLPVVREYIEPKNIFEFDITLDFELLSRTRLKINDFDDLINALEEATDYLIENTLELPDELYCQNLILGANTGFHQKTIVHALFKDKSERTQVVKILLHKGGTNAIRLHLNDKDSPRVINRIRKNGKLELAGLVEIRKISEKEVGK
ncbi:RAMP superfamily CRISPR-associated protein [uncultured Leptotrichia sp.]|uniref:RAMP superfamily CRISPR-associated protein n=1 Tax=uncultured Leptotrichia sp. TaxID=159271 RepID=UPI0026292039|nr:RAMP superfamily CRISPR-associated protein [uncultured Leptotrichia sp.]